MKKLKGSLYLIFTILMLSAFFALNTSAAQWQSGQCGENVKYIYNTDTNELTLSGSGPMDDYSASLSPFFNMKVKSLYIEEGITKIGAFAFECCTKLQNVYIPDSVAFIGNRAFINCDKLDNLVFSDSLKTIDDYGFYGCESLKSIVIPENVERLGAHCFSDCTFLQSVIISGGTKEISESAFESCAALDSALISSGVESIATNAFKFCFSLTSVMLPDTLSEISNGAFEQCYNLSGVYYASDDDSWQEIFIDSSENEYLLLLKPIYNEHIHKYSQKKYNKPTCISDGSKTYECACGDKILKSMSKTAHDFNGITTKATLSANGKIEIKCSLCGKVQEKRTISYPKTVKLQKSTYTYTGKKIEPTVIVKDSDGNALEQGEDYTISYSGTIKLPGKYKVTVQLMGDYSGSKTLEVKVIPKTVSGVKAKSQTTSSITLSYDKVVGATGYRIYKYNANTKKYEKVKTTSSLSCKCENLNAGSTYKFKVRAYYKTDDGTVIWGGYSEALTAATKPNAPKLKSATLKNKKATLTWSNVAGESGYQIYYATSKNGTYKKMVSVKGNTVSYTSSALSGGKTYYFKVRAYKKAGDSTVYSAFSEIKSVKVTVTYYVTKSGTKYHVDGCPSLSSSKIAISYKDAVAKGYKPCKVCIG